MKVHRLAQISLLVGFGVIMTACGDSEKNSQSDVEAYGASEEETHLVIQAPLASNLKQRLFVCQGTRVKPGTSKLGYLISIGTGQGKYRDIINQTTRNRNVRGSNLTPVGELRISAKLPYSCGEGMVTRCMQLDGVEYGVNHHTVRRDIYIHGTPSTNYHRLGKSASHGCVRMHQTDVKSVYRQVRVGTRVFINSVNLDVDHPCGFIGDLEGRAR